MKKNRFPILKAWTDLKDLPRELWILFISTLINRVGTMALPFLALYLTHSLHLSLGDAGLIMTSYGASALITGPFAGYLSDRLGALRVMVLSLFTSGIVLLTYPLATSFQEVLIVTVFFAITNETFRPANLSAISELVPTSQRKSAFALNRLATNLGMSVGPVVGSILAEISFPAIFIADGLTTLISAFFLIFSLFRFHWRKGRSSETANLLTEPQYSNVLYDPKLCYFLLAILPVIIVFFQYEAALPIYLVRDLHLPVSTYGLLFTVNTLMIIFLEIPLNSATSHWTFRRTLSFGSSLFAIGFGMLAFSKDIWSTIGTVVIWTFGEMILFPGMSAYVTEIAPSARRGQYMGLYTVSFSLSFTLGPWIGTQILEHYGGFVLWTSAFWFGLISTVLLSRIRN
jgi:MFS family permease